MKNFLAVAIWLVVLCGCSSDDPSMGVAGYFCGQKFYLGEPVIDNRTWEFGYVDQWTGIITIYVPRPQGSERRFVRCTDIEPALYVPPPTVAEKQE